MIRNLIVTILSFAVAGLFALFAFNLTVFNPIAQVVTDFEMTDVYYHILQDGDILEDSPDIVIVDMSDLYSRREIAATLDAIGKQKPRVVGVDVVFEGLKEDTLGDAMIFETAAKYDNIVYSYKLLDYQNDSIGYAESVHSFFAEAVPVMEGFTNMQRNLYGGLKRQLSLGRRYQGKLQPSFITKVVNTYQGKEIYKPLDKDLNINFSPRHYRVINPEDVSKSGDLIRGKVVLFGAMKDEYDMHYTPLGKIAGVELLGYSIDTLINQTEVKSASGWQQWIIAFLLVFFTETIFSFYKNRVSRIGNRFWRFLLSATFFRSYLMFLWMAVWVWLGFILFCKYNFSLNFGWAFSAIAFLVLAEGIIKESIEAYNSK